MPNVIHIQHVLLTLQPGGLENGVVNVVNRMDPAQFRSSVCCLRIAGDFASRISQPSAVVHQMLSPPGNDWRLPFRLAKLFSRTKTEIVHTRNAEAFFYGFLGAKLARVPTIIHSEHGRTFQDREIRNRLQRLFTQHTTAVFAVSAQLKRDLAANVGLDASKISVLHNGVDLGEFRGVAESNARMALGLKPSNIVIGSVGRLATVKNFGLLIRAVARLGINRVFLMLVGDGPERRQLEALSTAEGLSDRTLFLGHRNDVTELLRAMDIFVLPSFSEGMSNTLLEAMASRLPVVASNVGGNPEIVRDGLDGFLFDCDDENSLVSRLRQLIDNPLLRQNFARSARQRVEDEFSISTMVSRYEDLYRSCANLSNN